MTEQEATRSGTHLPCISHYHAEAARADRQRYDRVTQKSIGSLPTVEEFALAIADAASSVQIEEPVVFVGSTD